MNILTFSGLLLGASFGIGTLGTLIGIGGGIIITPLLVLLFGVDMHYAMGATLCCVIANSLGATITHLKKGRVNLRVSFLLALATTTGALLGASLALQTHRELLMILFGALLLFLALLSFFKNPDAYLSEEQSSPLAKQLLLNGSNNHPQSIPPYGVKHLLPGFFVMSLDGFLSGFLGVGSGALKVIILDRLLQLPLKISIATSSFMIGLTATASAGLYLRKGYIDPTITAPVVLGVLLGALLGAQLLPRTSSKWLQTLFYMALLLSGIKMILQGLS